MPIRSNTRNGGTFDTLGQGIPAMGKPIFREQIEEKDLTVWLARQPVIRSAFPSLDVEQNGRFLAVKQVRDDDTHTLA